MMIDNHAVVVDPQGYVQWLLNLKKAWVREGPGVFFKATRVSKEKQGLIRGGAQAGVWSVSERMS